MEHLPSPPLYDFTSKLIISTEILTHVLSHLPASSLATVSLVSKRFYSLVTTPHAWRIAFSRFFPGQASISSLPLNQNLERRENLRAEQRLFTRLTALATWRSEYILRTKLLRSLSRGKPAHNAPGRASSGRSNNGAQSNNANAVVTYSSQLFATINHIHANFNSGTKQPRFIHGTDETGSACTSDPGASKVDNWGLSDPQALPQFSDLFPGDQQYGLGNGLVGVPNSMDVSQPFGMIYGVGHPNGGAYFRSSEEMRGRFLAPSSGQSAPEAGIPQVPARNEAICSVWIAKSSKVPTLTLGLFGILTGSSLGVVTAYSLGADNLRENRISKGEITARWVISPGVPIIALAVDESLNPRRQVAGRVWAVALNALGECFYLNSTPKRTLVERGAKLDDWALEKLAWDTGRTTYWQLVEPTRRIAREDPYHENEYDGSYSPRSSSNAMSLSNKQLASEVYEIQKFLTFPPSHFRKVCEGWDMRRKLEVDFAGSDGHGAGEGIFVISCGVKDGVEAEVKRYTRVRSEQASLHEYPIPKTPPMAQSMPTMASLFGPARAVSPLFEASGSSPAAAISPRIGANDTISSLDLIEEWRASLFSTKSLRGLEITASTLDISTYALLTASEDPILTANGDSNTSSPFSTPLEQRSAQSVTDIPGYRARFLAIGTKTGAILVFNARGPHSTNSVITNEIDPLRTIQTDSPQITCLGLTALYLVHGGNDGLVQTWDPLASTDQPIRTLNSRFSSRARRRLIQAEASVQGVGINIYAAGAICLDPEPGVLRGMVSLGTHLRYWSYSGIAAESYPSRKRKLRRSGERGHNGGGERYVHTGRGALTDYIATEQEELKRDKECRAKEEARLRKMFGVGEGLTEEESLRLAQLVSMEEFKMQEQRRLYEHADSGVEMNTASASSATSRSAWSSETVTPEGSVAGRASSSAQTSYKTDDELNHEIEEAIRLSLLNSLDEEGGGSRERGRGEFEVSVRYKSKEKKTKRGGGSNKGSAESSPNFSGRNGSASGTQSTGVEADDLELALQLSLIEEEDRRRDRGESFAEGEAEEMFPALEKKAAGKGKGREV